MSTSTVLSVRPAALEDADRLLQWRNDPVTRGNSFRTEPIGVEEHRVWLRRTLEDPGTRMYIGMRGSTPCGVVRFESRSDGASEANIALDPAFRGQGLAASVLRLARTQYIADGGKDRTTARVKATNVASLRAFERAGYRRLRTAEGIVELETVD